MRFYLLCAAVLTLTVLTLSKCEAQIFVTTSLAAPEHHHGFHERKAGGRHNIKGERSYGMMRGYTAYRDALSAAVPFPRARPELEVLHPGRYPRLTPMQGHALSFEIMPTPMQEELTILLMAVGRWK